MIISFIFNIPIDNSAASGEVDTEAPPTKRAKSVLFSSYTPALTPCPDKTTAVRNLVNKYLDMVKASSPLSTTDAWAVMRSDNTFRQLHSLFEKVFTTPATSAPVERVFSQSGLIMRPNRARMHDSTLSNLVYLKCNMHVK